MGSDKALLSLLVAVEGQPGGIDWAGPDQWQRVASSDAFRDLDTPEDLRRYTGLQRDSLGVVGFPHRENVRYGYEKVDASGEEP